MLVVRKKEIIDEIIKIYKMLISSDEEIVESIIDSRKKLYVQFKKAQILILENLLKIEKEVAETKASLKSQKSDELKILLDDLIFYEKIFRNLADAIAYKIIGEKNIYIARRFYQDVKSDTSLMSSGFDLVLKVAEKINETDDFALISDLTSFVKVGDIISASIEGYYSIFEIKSGKKNAEASKILEGICSMKEKCSMSPSIEDSIDYNSKGDSNFKKQLQRMHRQNLRGQIIIDTYNNENVNLLSGETLEILNIKEEPVYYFDLIKEMLEESKIKDYAYRLIDDCLHVGVYRNNWRLIGYHLLSILIKDTRSLPVINFLQGMYIPLTLPIFLKKFSEENIFDILTGEIKIFFALDIDKYIKKSNELGTNLRWSTKKDTSKFIKSDNSKYFKLDNRVIISEGGHIISGDGFITRILFDSIRPNFIMMCNYETEKYLKNRMDRGDLESCNSV